ncbi:Interferon type B [Bienertia sinuspersici]
MEWVRRYVMSRFFAKKEGLKAFTSVIMPIILKTFHKGLLQVFNMIVSQANLYEFEVDDIEDTFVVNLKSKVCSCSRWTLMGIPFRHALACIQNRRIALSSSFTLPIMCKHIPRHMLHHLEQCLVNIRGLQTRKGGRNLEKMKRERMSRGQNKRTSVETVVGWGILRISVQVHLMLNQRGRLGDLKRE